MPCCGSEHTVGEHLDTPSTVTVCTMFMSFTLLPASYFIMGQILRCFSTTMTVTSLTVVQYNAPLY